MTTEPLTIDASMIAPGTILAAPRTAPALRARPASAMPNALPFTIDPPRGGMFDGRERRAGQPCAAPPRTASPSEMRMRARDKVLAAISPLLAACAMPAPTEALGSICDAAVAAIRATVANTVTSFRARLGAAGRDLDAAGRISVEDVAMMLVVDEVGLLDREAGLLSPHELVAAAVPGRTMAADAVRRAIVARVEAHLLTMIQAAPALAETTRATVLSILSRAPD